MEHIGIDVHKNQSQICILTQTDEVLELRIATRRERFAEVLGQRPHARILIEASTESEWVARCLEELGHEVIVADPSFAPMYGMRTRRVKTDVRDARALAEACRSGVYRLAHRRPERPRIGPVTAASFRAAVDDVKRLRGPHPLAAYLGLVPRETSSGERQHRGRSRGPGTRGRGACWCKRRSASATAR